MEVREKIVNAFSRLLYEKINEKILPNSKRTYGFEYELMPDVFPKEDFVYQMEGYLAKLNFIPEDKMLRNDKGVVVSFEPGGQIEFHSAPMRFEDTHLFSVTVQQIEQTIEDIRRISGVSYKPTAYVSGRETAPLCLTSERYINLHNRLSVSGTRGHEMMKGTASIHMHALILNMEEIPRLFAKLYELAESKELSMGDERKDILRNTDPTRCGRLFKTPDSDTTTMDFIRDYVEVGIDAIVLGTDKPFFQLPDMEFEDFLYHMTTLFTDVRINMNAPTLELRTLDALPLDQFKAKWDLFVSEVEGIKLA